MPGEYFCETHAEIFCPAVILIDEMKNSNLFRVECVDAKRTITHGSVLLPNKSHAVVLGGISAVVVFALVVCMLIWNFDYNDVVQ